MQLSSRIKEKAEKINTKKLQITIRTSKDLFGLVIDSTVKSKTKKFNKNQVRIP